MSDLRHQQLNTMLSRGCGIPAARDHAKLMLRIAERIPPTVHMHYHIDRRRTDWVLTCIATVAIAATFLWLGAVIGGHL